MTDVLEWDIKRVSDWLKSIKLPEYVDRFEEDAVDGACLMSLNEEELKGLGLKLGHLKKIMQEIKKLAASLDAHKPDPEMDVMLSRRYTSSGVNQVRTTATRMEDGIAEALITGVAQSSTNMYAFYSDDYSPPTTVEGFLRGLPAEQFPGPLVDGLFRDFDKEMKPKILVLQEQKASLTAADVLAIFAYSYEFPVPSKDGEHQIYRDVNEAMRRRQEPQLSFWRPFIFFLDRALAKLVPHEETVFRGVAVAFPIELYEEGALVTWPAFSSSAKREQVARRFLKLGTGKSHGGGKNETMFVLKTRFARRVFVYSHFPEEEEVLFPANSMFRVTKRLLLTEEEDLLLGLKTDIITMEQVDPAEELRKQRQRKEWEVRQAEETKRRREAEAREALQAKQRQDAQAQEQLQRQMQQFQQAEKQRLEAQMKAELQRQTAELTRKLQSESPPRQTLQGAGTRCTKTIPKGERYYECRTCQSDAQACLCAGCFFLGYHPGHVVETGVSNGGSTCDCGDERYVMPGGYCRQHGGPCPPAVMASQGTRQCGSTIPSGQLCYKCRTCETDPLACLCANCFFKGDHVGHVLETTVSGGKSTCDCGDEAYLRPSGNCRQHSPGAPPKVAVVPCGACIPSGQTEFQCRTCEQASNACLCFACFVKVDHTSHRVDTKLSNGNATCDCGDEKYTKKGGWCHQHGGPLPQPTIRPVVKGSQCGRTISRGETLYQCRTCEKSSSACLCFGCFRHGKHAGHQVTTEPSQGTATCDCGNGAYYKPSACCSYHPPG